MLTAATIAGMVAVLLVAGRVMSQVFQYVGLTAYIGEFFLGLPFGRYGILAVLYVMYLVLGCFVASTTMLILTAPFIGSILGGLSFSLLWFAIVFVIVAEIGMVTPPYGMNLFVLKVVVPEQGIMTIAIGCLPFILAGLLVVVILVAFPQLALWLPGIL